MIWLAAAAVMLCAATGCWVAHGWVVGAVRRYRQVYTDQAGAGLEEVFLFVDPRQLWWVNLALCGGVGLACYAALGSVAVAAAAGFTPVRLPHLLLAALRRRRQARFDGQLPDTLLALASSLRAGASVAAALRHIVEHAEAPLSQEFGLMLRQQRLGLPFDTTLANLAARMPSEAVAVLVSALRISAQTGGNLAEALERISVTLRATLQLQDRIRTLTAQGRMQAWVVGALAPLLALVLDALEPEAMAPLWHTPAGWGVLALLAGLQLAGMLWIRRIVRIDV